MVSASQRTQTYLPWDPSTIRHSLALDEDIAELTSLVNDVPSSMGLELDIDAMITELQANPSCEPKPPYLPFHYKECNVECYPRIEQQMQVIPLASATFQLPQMEVERYGFYTYTPPVLPVSLDINKTLSSFGLNRGYGYYNC